MIIRIITALIFALILNADNATATDNEEVDDAADSISAEDNDQPTTDIVEDDPTTTDIVEDDPTTKDVTVKDDRLISEAPETDNKEESNVSNAATSETPLPEIDSEEMTTTVDDDTEEPNKVSEDSTVATNQEETTITSEGEETTEAAVKFRANDESETEKSYKRINVDDVQHSAPLDLFKINREDLRRNQKDIWEWDYWCQLQPKIGEGCTQRNMRYYYDAQVDQCQQFIYTGCKGNKNNFNTIVECDRHCKGATFMTLKEAERKPPCELQPSAGLCLAMIPKYYFDVNEKTCKSFMYGGCGGNDNRFDSLQQCLQTCQGY